MNKKYIKEKLEEQGITVGFFTSSQGPAVRFFSPKHRDYWNALLPIGDEEDDRFVAFVIHAHRKCHEGQDHDLHT